MALPLGESFLQTDDEMTRRRKAAALGEALKVLSLRMPRVLGEAALAPELLLTSPGGAASPLAEAVANSVIQGILGGGQANAMAGLGGPFPLSAPAPAPTALQGAGSLASLVANAAASPTTAVPRPGGRLPTGQAPLVTIPQPRPPELPMETIPVETPGLPSIGPPRVIPGTPPSEPSPEETSAAPAANFETLLAELRDLLSPGGSRRITGI
jgi:hypothetical protein